MQPFVGGSYGGRPLALREVSTVFCGRVSSDAEGLMMRWIQRIRNHQPNHSIPSPGIAPTALTAFPSPGAYSFFEVTLAGTMNHRLYSRQPIRCLAQRTSP